MRVELYTPSWLDVPKVDLTEINDVIDGSWAEASSDYAADWRAKALVGKRGPVGVQKYLNAVLDKRFQNAGWGVYASTYTTATDWWRFTFRHQMSAGSNFLDALKVVGRYDYRIAVITAPTREFLEVISPADAGSLTSFEKIQAELVDLKGIISAPVIVASLQASSLPSTVSMEALSDPKRKRS